MNISSFIKVLVAIITPFFLTGICVAQSATLAPLGLPRLKDNAQPGDAAPVARSKFADTDLAAKDVTGAHAGEKRGAKFLTLDAATDWSQPLRGNAKDTLFVSFSVNGSAGTIIEIGEAKVGVVDSEIDNYAQLVVFDPSITAGSPWRRLALHVPYEKYDGQLLGSISVLTVRLDPANGSWDLYQGTRMLAEDLPLNAGSKNTQFIVHGGEAGAMINGFVQSDENPLYEDANANGIDDHFEQQAKGRLLGATDSKADRKDLIQQWRDHQRTERPAALFVNLPTPDGR
jgi:hypothetical protein